MSLYIGNVSSRIHRDELQRVFQKFGQCNVRLKDGYGFVVYEFPPDAEKALRALQKRYICGQLLTLTWSNKQPRPVKRLARAAGSFEPQHDRHSKKEQSYVKRKLGSKNQDYGINAKQSDGFSKRHGLTDMHDKEVGSHQGDAKDNLCQENHGCREEFEDEVGRSERDPLENDRWGEKFHDKPIEIGVGNAIEFERYEPYKGYSTKGDDCINQFADPGGSPSRRSPPKDIGRDHVNGNLKFPSNVKFNATCYRCGDSGHKMRNCPNEDSSFRNSTRFDRRHNDDIHRRGRGETEVGKVGSRSRERLQSSRDTVAKRRVKNDVKSSGVGKFQRPISSRNSPVRKETENYGGNKRSRNKISSSLRRGTKKTRMSILSPCGSDYTASPSYSISQSTEHVKRSSPKNRSKSPASRAHPPPSESNSSSTPLDSRSRKSKSRARSSSHTSLSISFGRPLPSSSNKAQLNLKGSSDNATTPESKVLSIELDQPLEGGSGFKDKTHENIMVVVNNENVVLPSQAEINLKKDQPLKKANEVHSFASGSLHEVTNVIEAAVAEKDTADSPKRHTHQNSDKLMTEHVLVPMKNPDSESLVGSNSGNPTSISSEELSFVLKHYCGHHFQNESERHLPADAYFGSARMWPWEVIYYRRLKKGPISLENYARRVDQNRDFGIVDKYIRSSSGWGELHRDNP
ncbi:uncharacterized protein [Euphorbia lathyris]|uniref:uncharacterized protein n=1 Tax=Euphorbia lathyris TaxID=212925 RepID=UPI0033135623